MNISFTPADNYSGSVSATVDGKAYDSNILNRDRKVQIENIPANDLGKMYTVMLEANGVNTVNASALSYVSIVFNQTGSSMGNVDMDTMRRAVTALYRYYAATRAYFGTGE